MKRAKRHPPPLPAPRNPVARSPLMRKGGVHQRSTGAARRAAKMDVQKLLGRSGEPE